MYKLETSEVEFEIEDEKAKWLLDQKLVVLEQNNVIKLDGGKLYDVHDVEEILHAINGEETNQ